MANNKAIIVELDKEVDTSLALNSIRQQEPVPNPCVETTNEPVVTKKCNHFSIRGYVSEVRKKDPKICYPFPLNESIDPIKELPPMTIPESRWWRCSGCVPEAKNYDIRLSNDSRGAAAKEEAQKGVNVNASNNNNLLLGLSSKVDNTTAARVRVPAEAITSTDSDYNKNNTPVVSNTLSDRKGKGKAHVTYDEIPPFSGRENGSLSVSSNQKPFQQTTVQSEINQLATDNNEDVRVKSNQNRTAVGLHKENTAGRSEVGPSNGYSRGDPQTSTQHRHSESPSNGLVARVADNVSGSSSRSQGLVKLPDLNQCSDEPSDELHNEAIVTGNCIILCDDDDDYLGTERRKRPKSRLMSELLNLKGTQYTGKGKKKMISSTSSQDENVKRKRIEIVISESEDESDSSDVSDEKISGFSGKRVYKCKNPLPEMSKKKIKMDNGASSSVSQQKFTKPPKPSHEKGKSSAEELPQRVDIFTHLSELNKAVKRKRGTGAPARNMTKESGATQKDGEAEQSSTENVGRPSENVGHFLSNYPNKENNQPLLQKKEGFYPSSSQAPKGKESRHYEETRGVTISRTTSAVGAPITGNKSDPEKHIDHPTRSSKEKTTRTPETDRCRPPAQDTPIQVSNSEPNQKQQTKEVRGRVHDIDINSIPTDDKPTELGPGDDNLMEIAELMVKIRHDQQRNEPMANPVTSGIPRPLPVTNVRQSETQGSYGQPMQIFRSSPVLSQQKPPSTMVNGNSSQYSYYNSNNVGARALPRESQNPVSSRFVYPNQDVQQVHPYSARRLPPSNFAQAVDSHQKFQAWSPQQSLTQPSSALPPPGMPSRMPLGITNPRQMISPRLNTLNDGRFRQQNSRTILNFENPESSSSRSTGVDVNEAIPAMHLLSLMQNAATVQNTELSLGPQRLVAPSASPSPSPSPSSSRFTFSENNSRTFAMQDNSRHPCYQSALPAASPFPSSLHNDKGIMSRNRGINGFMGPIPLTLGGQRNMENSRFSSPPSRNSRPPRQVRRPMAPPLDKGKSIASTSNPTSVNNNPLPQVAKESLNLQCEEPVTPSEPEKITCKLNQNPSEFNDLKLLSKYMNGPEDLWPRKTSRDNASQPREN